MFILSIFCCAVLVNFGWKVQLLIFMNSSFMILVGWQHSCGDHWECPNQCQIFDLWVTGCLADFTQISEIETLRQRHRCPACVAILDQKSSAVTLEQYDLYRGRLQIPPSKWRFHYSDITDEANAYLLARPPQSPSTSLCWQLHHQESQTYQI